MNLLGLDLSMTQTGYACSVCGVGVINSKPDADRMRRFNRIASLVVDNHYHDTLTLAVIEGYSFGSRSGQAHSLGELGGIVRYSLWLAEIPFAEVSPASLKKFTTGKGNANKDEMLAAAIRHYGYEGSNNNEADAWMLLKMAERHFERKPLLTNYQVEALCKIDWPELDGAV